MEPPTEVPGVVASPRAETGEAVKPPVAEAEVPAQTAGKKKLLGAAKSVQSAVKQDKALSALGVKKGDQSRDEILKLAAMSKGTHSEVLSGSQKTQLLLLFNFIQFCDTMAGGLMTLSVPRMLMPCQDGQCSQAQIDGGWGCYSSYLKDVGGMGTAQFISPALLDGAMFGVSLICLGLVRIVTPKGYLMITCGGGCLSFILMAQMKDAGLYGYWASRCFNGLFCYTAPIMMIWARAYWPPDQKLQAYIAMSGAAFAADPLAQFLAPILMGDEEANLFAPAYLAAAVEGVACILVIYILKNPDGWRKLVDPEVPKVTGSEDMSWKHKVYWFWGIRTLVSVVQQTFFQYLFAVGLFRYYPDLLGKNKLNLMIQTTFPCILCSLPIAFTAMGKLGPAGSGLLSCVLMAVLYIVRASIEMPFNTFLVLHYLNFAAMMMGGVTEDAAISALVPEPYTTQWTFKQESYMQSAQIWTPLIMPQFIDREKWGPYPKGCEEFDMNAMMTAMMNNETFVMPETPCEMVQSWVFPDANLVFEEHTSMYVCVALLVIAAGMYVRLLQWLPLPKPPAEPPETEEEATALSTFKGSGDATWLSARQLMKMNMERHAESKPLIKAVMTPFQDDLNSNSLDKIRDAAKVDLQWSEKETLSYIQQWRGSAAFREEMKGMIEGMWEQSMTWTDDDKTDFGQWFCDWMNYAGYESPTNSPRVYKAMIMQAFPKMHFGGKQAFLDDPVPTMLRYVYFCRNMLQLDNMNAKMMRRATANGSLSVMLSRYRF